MTKPKEPRKSIWEMQAWDAMGRIAVWPVLVFAVGCVIYWIVKNF